MTRALVAGWIGSTNLGDELVLAGLLQLLRGLDVTDVCAVSVDPERTRREHGIEAVSVSGVLGAARDADVVIFGGGGLLQDETSPYNLPYHLARVWAAQAVRTPVVGLGLGAGRLTTPLGRALVRRTFATVPLAVRDAPSADLLAGLGLPRPLVAADLALALPPVEVEAQDRFVVSLRPWSGPSRGAARVLPASLRARGGAGVSVEGGLQATARALDELADATGLQPHLVALQADRDGPLHDAIAERMRHPATVVRPSLAELPGEIGSGRVVVGMRYHAGICAVLAARPVVLIGYSPKVDALAGPLGAGAALLPWRPDGPQGLAEAVAGVVGKHEAVRQARSALRAAAQRNAELLAR